MKKSLDGNISEIQYILIHIYISIILCIHKIYITYIIYFMYHILSIIYIYSYILSNI